MSEQKLLDYDIDYFLGYLIFLLRENDIDVLFSFKLRQTFTKEWHRGKQYAVIFIDKMQMQGNEKNVHCPDE